MALQQVGNLTGFGQVGLARRIGGKGKESLLAVVPRCSGPRVAGLVEERVGPAALLKLVVGQSPRAGQNE